MITKNGRTLGLDIKSAILNFEILTSDSNLVVQDTPSPSSTRVEISVFL